MSVPVGPDMRIPDGEVRLRRAQPLPRHARPHPLAAQEGVELLLRVVAADRQWRLLTATQRRILVRAYEGALRAAITAEVGEDASLPLPVLPAGAHPNTVESLRRRGLVAGAALTPLAVEMVSLTRRLNEPRSMRTCAPVNGEYL